MRLRAREVFRQYAVIDADGGPVGSIQDQKGSCYEAFDANGNEIDTFRTFALAKRAIADKLNAGATTRPQQDGCEPFSPSGKGWKE